MSVCRACPRLVAWRETVATEKRRAFADEPYWGRPVPGWGDERPRVLVVGLAPAAHGGNRTGRIFTGDRSGDWLFAALHRAGWPSSRPAPTAATASAGRAPGCSRPSAAPRRTTSPRRRRAGHLRAVAGRRGRGRPADAAGGRRARRLRLAGAVRDPHPPRPPGAPTPPAVRARCRGRPSGRWRCSGCFHPSQQNTFTGRLTEPMLDQVLGRGRHDDR